MTKVLVVVHPGSLCGSANFTLGKTEARAVRDAVAGDLDGWQGSVLVLDGALSDELPDYPVFLSRLEAAVGRGQEAGFGLRVEADDPIHGEVAVRTLREQGVPLDAEICLTGAWYEPDGSSGCVTWARDCLVSAGFSRVSVLDSAACESEVPDDDEEGDLGDRLAVAFSPRG